MIMRRSKAMFQFQKSDDDIESSVNLHQLP